MHKKAQKSFEVSFLIELQMSLASHADLQSSKVRLASGFEAFDRLNPWPLSQQPLRWRIDDHATHG